ncbi:MAG: solute-binding protein [Myxococcales bacterium]|nr:solute-binding protein [Myxococcales bacterium]
MPCRAPPPQRGSGPATPRRPRLRSSCSWARPTKPDIEEAAALYEKQHAGRVLLHFGGSGKMLSEMKLAQRGDLYFLGSSDFMDLAKRKGLVLSETGRRVPTSSPPSTCPPATPRTSAPWRTSRARLVEEPAGNSFGPGGRRSGTWQVTAGTVLTICAGIEYRLPRFRVAKNNREGEP